jgi:F-type H+-transporting ATPase subunit c
MGTTSWRQIHNEEKSMRKFAWLVLAICAVALLAPAAFAQGGEAAPAGGFSGWVPLTAGFAMAIASLGGALGQGKATAQACEALARNPAAEGAIRFALILGLVLIESMALYTFAIIFLKVK